MITMDDDDDDDDADGDDGDDDDDHDHLPPDGRDHVRGDALRGEVTIVLRGGARSS